MNAERLLAHYERIADTRDAIPRLRRLILDLGARGKLTSYRAATNEVTKLGRLAEFVMGQAPPGNTCNDRGEGTLFVKVGEFGDRFPEHRAWTTQPLKFARTGDVLICVVGATIGKLNLGTDCAIGRSVAAIRPCPELDQTFLYYSLMPFTLRLRESARGTAQGVISRPDLDKIAIWLPPLPEQHRIVAKVDELMALCDQLEKSRTAREETRDRLTAASLARLNDPAPETFQTDARFALDALPSMTARPDQIKQLRQSILNLAVRGRLVPQDPNEEPAAKLLEKILAQPWEKKRNPANLLPSQSALNLTYILPSAWAWATVDLLVRPNETVTYGILKPVWVKNGVPTVRVTEMKTGRINVESLPHCDPLRAAKFKKTTLASGDLLISKDGTIGKTAFVPPALIGGNITQHVLRFPIIQDVCAQFVRMAIDAPFSQAWMAGETKGVALQGVNVGDFRRMPIPVPPLAEQERIVAKVDELMTLCDRLEASLAAGTTARTRLLDALLSEAIAPIDAPRLEAAE